MRPEQMFNGGLYAAVWAEFHTHLDDIHASLLKDDNQYNHKEIEKRMRAIHPDLFLCDRLNIEEDRHTRDDEMRHKLRVENLRLKFEQPLVDILQQAGLDQSKILPPLQQPK